MATLAIKVNAECRLVNNDDRIVLRGTYKRLTIIGLKSLDKCSHPTDGKGGKMIDKINAIRNRSNDANEIHQMDFIVEQGGAFLMFQV